MFLSCFLSLDFDAFGNNSCSYLINADNCDAKTITYDVVAQVDTQDSLSTIASISINYRSNKYYLSQALTKVLTSTTTIGCFN